MTPPEGWYTDPHTPLSQRYWDGANWTDQVRPTPPETGAPPPVQVTMVDKRTPQFSCLGAIIVILALVGGVVAIMAVLGAFNGDSSNEPTKATQPEDWRTSVERDFTGTVRDLVPNYADTNDDAIKKAGKSVCKLARTSDETFQFRGDELASLLVSPWLESGMGADDANRLVMLSIVGLCPEVEERLEIDS